jgi:mannitol/fructose-specific phosphotransferase system IIA component (Ntr-type)
MRLENFLSENSILLNVPVFAKAQLLDRMIESLVPVHAVTSVGLTYDTIKKAILRREQQASTGIGGGFAMPHARFSELSNPVIALALLESPLDFESIDRKPVNVVCMILCPEKHPTLALKVMSQIAKLFSDSMVGEKIFAAKTAGDVLNFIKQSDLSLDIPIMARDIMREPIVKISPDMPLPQVTRMMSEKRLSAVPVTDGDSRLLGEISCGCLFRLGIPEFFTQLKSVAFISDFDPFEKYFHNESVSNAGGVMSKQFCALPPDSTMLEIVFALAVNKYPNVYIVKDNKLVGIVDRSTVLEQVINV